MDVPDGVYLESRHYEILTSASIADQQTHVLKAGDTFAIFDAHGDFTPAGNFEQGLYHDGTRFLSKLQLWIGTRRPVLLGSSVRDDNTLLTVDLTNPDFRDTAGRALPHGTLHLRRSKLLWNDRCLERLSIHSFADRTVHLSFSFVADADFADIFEVRGSHRSARGDALPPAGNEDCIILGYVGRDDVQRRTLIAFSPRASAAAGHEVRFEVEIEPHGQLAYDIDVACTSEPVTPPSVPHSFDEAYREIHASAERLQKDACQISTSNAQFDAWLTRSLDDLNLLLTAVPHGYYPYAGIPWYNTFFGRDGILTALMSLWINPDIARGVLGYLADSQAVSVDPSRQAQPGKILHESRKGEMAALREIPFDRYYGTVDATPLFVLLAGRYLKHTGDVEFIRGILDHILAALAWIDEFGDVDGDGFVEYAPDPRGLVHQGWKDSEDSVFHADGSAASGSIALSEVQSYVYGAKLEAAALLRKLGRDHDASRLAEEAETLKRRFQSTFWVDDISAYALALDGSNRPCAVRSSNAGHALFTGIASEEHAALLVHTLFSPDLFSGWGIRTISSKERRYNPLSYHNGSVWPHDNAIIGAGLARYGYRKEAGRLLEAFFDAGMFDPQQRLPELFCGFDRRRGDAPTPYPVACSPQAWASATVFYLLQSCIGLRIDAARRRVVIDEPYLPPFLGEVRVRNLRVGDASVDLLLQGYTHSVGVNVTNRSGSVEVVTVK